MGSAEPLDGIRKRNDKLEKKKKLVSLNEIGHGTRREYDSGIGYGFHRKQRYLDKETSIVIQVLVVE